MDVLDTNTERGEATTPSPAPQTANDETQTSTPRRVRTREVMPIELQDE